MRGVDRMDAAQDLVGAREFGAVNAHPEIARGRAEGVR